MDRYLKPARERMRIKGISTTKPSPLLRNSITIHLMDERPRSRECQEAKHCGALRPGVCGEFARTLTMTDLMPHSAGPRTLDRNSAARSGSSGASGCQQRFHSR